MEELYRAAGGAGLSRRGGPLAADSQLETQHPPGGAMAGFYRVRPEALTPRIRRFNPQPGGRRRGARPPQRCQPFAGGDQEGGAPRSRPVNRTADRAREG